MGALHPTEHHGGLMAQYLPTIDFTASPTLGRAFMDGSYFVGVEGPPGSGKTIWSIAKLMSYALTQEPGPDNVRRTRWAIIRNTYPDLKSTTIQSWQAIMKPEFTAPVVYSSPIQWHYKRPPYQGQPGLDVLVYFLALDNASDVRKLKSLELTGAWVNEATEIVPEILEVLTTRCGRFPSVGRFTDEGSGELPAEAVSGVGATWQGIIADTNAGDDDNWWHRWKVQIPDETLKGNGRDWSFYTQPPAVLECQNTGSGWQVNEPGFEPVPVAQREVVHAAGRYWCVNPAAENLRNLTPNYYQAQLPNKTLGFIQRYLQVKTIYLADGKPVVPEFAEIFMVGDLPYEKDRGLLGGIDIGSGTLQPAAVIGQRGQHSDLRALREFPMFDMGLDRFATNLELFIMAEFGVPHWLVEFGLDPAAGGRDGLYEVTWLMHLRSKKFNVQLVTTNDPETRRNALALPMGRLIHIPGARQPKPGFMVDRSCKMLIAGLAGKWCYRRVQVSGTERYQPTPEKNKWSNVCEAAEYFAMRAGEGKNLTHAADPRHGGPPQRRQVTPSMDFSPFGGNLP
jgi:hypothetical protein